VADATFTYRDRQVSERDYPCTGTQENHYCSTGTAKGTVPVTADFVEKSPPSWAERFWSMVDRSQAGPAACWPWTRSKVKGYGSFHIRRGGSSKRAHRLAYELTNGPVPAGLVVMHLCDRPECCQPAHLSVGTHADNHRDAVRKGRWSAERVNAWKTFHEPTRRGTRPPCRCGCEGRNPQHRGIPAERITAPARGAL